MHTIEITGIGFCAAHRVEGHPKCSRLHGHNYVISLCLQGEVDTRSGFIADFGEVKQIVKQFVDDKLDHRYLVSARNLEDGDVYYDAARGHILIADDCVVLPVPQTTAEYLAEYLWNEFSTLIGYKYPNVSVWWVDVQETGTSHATYYNPEQD